MNLIVLLSLFASASAAAESFADSWRDLWLRKDQQAQTLLQEGKPAQAAPLYSDPRRRAYAELKAQQFANAAQRLAPLKDAQSEYNRGNALAHTGDLKNALAAYDAALAQTPGDKDTRHNRDLVARALQDQQQKSSQNKSGKSNSDQKQSDQSGSDKDQSDKEGSNKDKSETADSDKNRSADNKPDRKNSNDSKTNSQNGKDDQQQPAKDRADAAAEKEAAQKDAEAALAKAQQAKAQQGHQQPASANSTSNGDQKKSSAEMRARADNEDAKPQTEQALAMDQWLRRIPDDPAGLLRRKFLIEHMLKQREAQQ